MNLIITGKIENLFAPKGGPWAREIQKNRVDQI